MVLQEEKEMRLRNAKFISHSKEVNDLEGQMVVVKEVEKFYRIQGLKYYHGWSADGI